MFGDWKKVTFFPELYFGFMSINVFFPILKSVELKKKNLFPGLINKCSQSKAKLWKTRDWLLRDPLEEENGFGYNLGRCLLSSWFWLLHCHLVFKGKQMSFFLFRWGFSGLFNFWLVRVVFSRFNDLPTFTHLCFVFTHSCFLLYLSEQRAFSLNETPREKR